MALPDPKIKVLFITHSMVLGGAPTSLDLLVRNLDPERFECVIACIHPTPEVVSFHRAAGVEVIEAPGIVEFPHTTGGWLRLWRPRHLLALARAVLLMPSSRRATQRLLAAVRPDVVHLNSVILVSAAEGTKRAGIPLVWHVRESAVRGHLGIRRAWLARKVRDLPDMAIFLTSDDRSRLGAPRPNWTVIPNWTSFDERSGPSKDEARDALELAGDAPTVLFLGGFSRLKGCDTLLEAWPQVRRANDRAVCMLGGITEASARWRALRALLRAVGVRRDRDRLEEHARACTGVRLLPFRTDIDPLFAASDLLVFPAAEPHFPRPVIEAFARKLPVVASDLPPIREVADGDLAVLTPAGDADALAGAILATLGAPDAAAARVERAFREGRRRFSPESAIAEIEGIYRKVTS